MFEEWTAGNEQELILLVTSRRAHRDGEPAAVVRRPRGAWIVEALHGCAATSHSELDCPAAVGTVADVEPHPEPAPDPDPDSELAPASEPAGAEPAGLDPRAVLLEQGAGLLAVAVELERGLAQLAAGRARALASFARCRPASWDRQPGEQGAASAESRAARPRVLTEVSEWAADEVAARLRLPGRTAGTLLAECVELVEQLPATLASLEAGDISWAHARALIELLRPVSDEKKGQVEARVLPRAGRQTVAQLRECTKRAIARIDADAALRRLVKAVAGRKVTRHPGEDGMAVLTALLPAPVARACEAALRAYAEACAVDEDGAPDPRSLDQRMADCLADLILRPDAAGRSPVQVLLTVIATAATLTGTGPDADEPGEIDGETVPAALIRELAHALGLLPRPTTEPAEPAQPAEDPAPAQDQALTEAVEDIAPAENAGPVEDAAARLGARPTTEEPAAAESATEEATARGEALAALLDLRTLTDTPLAQRPRIALVDQLSGCLLALTDSIELTHAARSGRGLGPPAESPGYRPSRPLDRFVGLRDRRCRFPGCRARRVHRDHTVPHPLGPTAHTNLESLCEHHHRLSHQAPGWQLSGSPVDGLNWTLPGGTTITTVPPRFGTDDGTTPDSTSGSNPDAATASAGPAPPPPTWSQLTKDQRKERLRALIDPQPTPEQQADAGPAPF